MYALLSVFSLLDVILNLSQKFPAASQLPLKGIFQGIKLIGAIIIGILMISLLIGQSPAILISSLGAMAAVLMLVFKDPILGLVAGIQLSANDMLKLGDWLEMPKYGADGAVIDIGLTTVKVRNWDNTITTIPTWSWFRTLSKTGAACPPLAVAELNAASVSTPPAFIFLMRMSSSVYIKRIC